MQHANKNEKLTKRPTGDFAVTSGMTLIMMKMDKSLSRIPKFMGIRREYSCKVVLIGLFLFF